MNFNQLKPTILLFLAVFLAACEKQEDMAVTNLSDAQAASLTISPSSVVLKKDTKDAEAVKLSLTAADFGYKAAVKNSVQFAPKGSNFASPKEIALDVNVLERSFKGIELNDIALALGIKAEATGILEVRVKSEISTAIAPTYSAVKEVTVTPFALISYVYVPGDYQGWNPATADSLVSVLGDGKYEGVINFAAKPGGSLEFKITPAKAWTVAYGDAGGGKVSTTAGNNLKVASEYSYKLSLNTGDNTFTAERYSYGIIGDATPGGWDNDTNMMYNNGTREWSLTLPLIGGKKIKFRLNDDWGTNYGDTGANGSLDSGGDDISIATSGTYKVTFSLVTNSYSLTKL